MRQLQNATLPGGMILTKMRGNILVRQGGGRWGEKIVFASCYLHYLNIVNIR
jgi:hypothetical protein